MIKKTLGLLGLLFLIQSTAMACSAMGVNKHVGQVTATDAAAHTFTIMDMQLQKPITFNTTAALVKQAGQSKGTVTVTFEQKNNQLIATLIEI